MKPTASKEQSDVIDLPREHVFSQYLSKLMMRVLVCENVSQKQKSYSYIESLKQKHIVFGIVHNLSNHLGERR